ncbi:hypothetical protein BD289DRAFT_437328 [Coniella lustricola]|uniref:Endoplasmic reticulum junction formation protein lunapark n=1 Tax=Coniella lustricola TaxID=2025994 RepID=A0A2T3A441_9PEZI|nr:hypothetical protein BD289DRAFT_437328 [Coniella lustricola]
MVSLWPFKKDDSSPASFERSLSLISAKISRTQANLESNRAAARRMRVLGTLYLSLAYFIYATVALLVVGWNKMGAYEWTGMAGGPILIYLVRTISTTIYELRIETLSSRLKDQQTERAKTIQKLKAATKYDSTLELLEKYGGGDGKPKLRKRNTGEQQDDASKKSSSKAQKQATGQGNRTTMPPPPTANIQRHNAPPAGPGAPRHELGLHANPQQQLHRLPSSDQRLSPAAEFSPNAFDSASFGSRPGPHHEATHSSNHWYDRIMDVLLGEDETAVKNRYVLICQSCRLVNGQAPPGTTSLSELGMWKCMGCGAANGEIDEGKRLVKEVLGQHLDQASTTDGDHDEVTSSEISNGQSLEPSTESDAVVVTNDDEQVPGANDEPVPTAKSKGKGKGKGKK